MSKITLLTAGAVGYVLGARAGRERYDQIAAGAQRFMGNPKVQQVKQQAQDTLSEQASAAGSALADKAREAASTASDKVRSNGSANSSGTHAAEPAGTTYPPTS